MRLLPILLLTVALNLSAETESPAKEYVALEQFRQITAAALTTPDAPALFRDHVLSLRALVDQAEVQRDKVPLEETIRYVEAMNEGLAFDALKPETYLKHGKRSLVFTFTSEVDGSLQYYSCGLPPGYDPEVAYPLVVDLHGAGPEHPLFYVFIHIATPPDKEAYLKERPINPETAVITIRPWGRGNQGYRGAAQNDIRQSMADAAKRFKLDADRYYLVGHSMGGFAVWNVASAQPDIWAAACIVAGGSGYDPQYARQLASLPIRIWTGAEDPAVHPDNAYLMEELLREAGNQRVSLRVVEGWGHEVPAPEEAKANLEWMLQFKKGS